MQSFLFQFLVASANAALHIEAGSKEAFIQRLDNVNSGDIFCEKSSNVQRSITTGAKSGGNRVESQRWRRRGKDEQFLREDATGGETTNKIESTRSFLEQSIKMQGELMQIKKDEFQAMKRKSVGELKTVVPTLHITNLRKRVTNNETAQRR